MDEKKSVGLSVRELLKEAYEGLRGVFTSEEVNLNERVMTEIANDSDYHRSRIGYMCYESVLLLQINNNTWAIGRGERCGSYPADPYDSDLMVFEISREGKSREELLSEIKEAIKRNTYFQSSLIYGKWNGNLATSQDCRLGKKMVELLEPRISEFIAQKPEVDPEVIHLDLRPVYKTHMSYKPEFVGFLVKSIKTVLSS